MKNVILKVYTKTYEDDKYKEEIQNIIPGVLYNSVKLIRPKSSEQETTACCTVKIFKNIKLVGNEIIKIHETRYKIIKINKSCFIDLTTLYLSEISGEC